MAAEASPTGNIGPTRRHGWLAIIIKPDAAGQFFFGSLQLSGLPLRHWRWLFGLFLSNKVKMIQMRGNLRLFLCMALAGGAAKPSSA